MKSVVLNVICLTNGLFLFHLQVAARIGASSAPFIGQGLKPFGLSVPFVVMGIPSIIAAITGLYLPETQNMSMIESVASEHIDHSNGSTSR